MFDRPRLLRALFALLLVAGTLAVRWPVLDRKIWNLDERSTITMAQQILDGQVLFRDAADNRTPLVPYVKALVLAVAGDWNARAIHRQQDRAPRTCQRHHAAACPVGRTPLHGQLRPPRRHLHQRAPHRRHDFPGRVERRPRDAWLAERTLDPAAVPADRGLHVFTVELPASTNGQARLLPHTRAGRTAIKDWTCWGICIFE